MSAVLLATMFVAQTSVCGSPERAKLEGPSPLGFLGARFGAPRSACAGNELELAATGDAIFEPDDLFGDITVAGVLAGRVRVLERGEIFGAFELVRYETVISALSASSFGIGDLTLGGAWRFVDGPTLAVTGFGRFLLPTTPQAIRRTRPFGLDAGVSGRWQTSDEIAWFGHLALLGTIAASRATSDPRGGVALAAGGTWRPTHGFALVYELDGQLGYGGALDHLALGVGFRSHLDRRGFELFFKVPVVGRERALALAGLRLRYDFDVATDRRLR